MPASKIEQTKSVVELLSKGLGRGRMEAEGEEEILECSLRRWREWETAKCAGRPIQSPMMSALVPARDGGLQT